MYVVTYKLINKRFILSYFNNWEIYFIFGQFIDSIIGREQLLTYYEHGTVQVVMIMFVFNSKSVIKLLFFKNRFFVVNKFPIILFIFI